MVVLAICNSGGAPADPGLAAALVAAFVAYFAVVYRLTIRKSADRGRAALAYFVSAFIGAVTIAAFNDASTGTAVTYSLLMAGGATAVIAVASPAASRARVMTAGIVGAPAWLLFVGLIFLSLAISGGCPFD